MRKAAQRSVASMEGVIKNKRMWTLVHVTENLYVPAGIRLASMPTSGDTRVSMGP